jgi:citrate lyase beta subunit
MHSLLFVPGDRPERFAKAAATGAHAVILDLEDAVVPQAKEAARQACAAWLEAGHEALVRINSIGTAWHTHDLSLLSLPGVRGVMMPKAESAADIAAVAARLPEGKLLVALVETVQGISISSSTPASKAMPTSCSMPAPAWCWPAASAAWHHRSTASRWRWVTQPPWPPT